MPTAQPPATVKSQEVLGASSNTPIRAFGRGHMPPAAGWSPYWGEETAGLTNPRIDTLPSRPSTWAWEPDAYRERSHRPVGLFSLAGWDSALARRPGAGALGVGSARILIALLDVRFKVTARVITAPIAHRDPSSAIQGQHACRIFVRTTSTEQELSGTTKNASIRLPPIFVVQMLLAGDV